ncbi:hypothetical protein F5X96DRAFT_665683 [Biscogniauxia mediterranea]|nr:hypothetical protein F5X96DRAFT_665683 [Biscogniauxia mediterranea]
MLPHPWKHFTITELMTRNLIKHKSRDEPAIAGEPAAAAARELVGRVSHLRLESPYVGRTLTRLKPRDRELAALRSRTRNLCEQLKGPSTPLAFWQQELLARIQQRFMAYVGGHRPWEGDITVPGPFPPTRDINAEDQSNSTRCDICAEEGQDTRQLECRHNLCKSCICSAVKAAVLNRTRWPPNCCCYYHPTEEDIAWAGGPEMLKTYRDINREFFRKNPTYCSRQQCSELLDEDEPDREGMLTCKTCGTRTCTKCKQGSHEEHGCVRFLDPALEATIKNKGWQRCRLCWRVISLESGCNHMRCLCGFEFCYFCGKRWGMCNCTEAVVPLLRRTPNAERSEEGPFAGPPTSSSDELPTVLEYMNHRYLGDARPGIPQDDDDHDDQPNHSNPVVPHSRLPLPSRFLQPNTNPTEDDISASKEAHGSASSAEGAPSGKAVQANGSSDNQGVVVVAVGTRGYGGVERFPHENDGGGGGGGGATVSRSPYISENNHLRALRPVYPFHQQLPDYYLPPPPPPPRLRDPPPPPLRRARRVDFPLRPDPDHNNHNHSHPLGSSSSSTPRPDGRPSPSPPEPYPTIPTPPPWVIWRWWRSEGSRQAGN